MKHLERGLDKQNQGWKLIVLYLVVPFTMSITYACLNNVVSMIAQKGGKLVGQISNGSLSPFVSNIDPNLRLASILLPFVVGLITIGLMFKILYKRNIKEVINGTNHIRWNRFFYALMLWGLIMGLLSLIGYWADPNNYEFHFNISSFIPLLLISVILIPFQATLEEVFFRGYLTPTVAVWTKSRWFALFIPAIFFAFAHYSNPEVKEYGFWLTMPVYLLLGLLFGLITILDDGIELAMGTHAANNILSAAFFSFRGSAFPTATLLTQKQVSFSIGSALFFLLICIIFVIILARKYKWRFSVLNKKLVYSTSEPDDSLKEAA